MFGPHENYCADFSTREDAQEYIFWVESRVASPKAFPFGIEGEDGREYFEISSCCSLCEEKGEVQDMTKENEFKAARKRLGLTQKKLSEVLDIPKRTIEDWEGGRRNPPEWVKKLVLEKMESMKQ
jgi:DNA-binding XRE family transcriptional regulator